MLNSLYIYCWLVHTIKNSRSTCIKVVVVVSRKTQKCKYSQILIFVKQINDDKNVNVKKYSSSFTLHVCLYMIELKFKTTCDSTDNTRKKRRDDETILSTARQTITHQVTFHLHFQIISEMREQDI